MGCAPRTSANYADMAKRNFNAEGGAVACATQKLVELYKVRELSWWTRWMPTDDEEIRLRIVEMEFGRLVRGTIEIKHYNLNTVQSWRLRDP